LNFDFAKNDSNYSRLRDDALKENNGFTYVTPFATQRAFSRVYPDPSGALVSFSDTNSNQYSDFTSLYFGQADANDGRGSSISACSDAVRARLSGSDLVARGPTGDGGLPVPRDGGKPITGPIAADYTCSGHDDIAAAVIGMHPDTVWVSRLEMNLPREALMMDCNVGLASTQSGVSSQLKAGKATNVPCAGGTITGGMAESFANSTSTCVWTTGSLLALVVARRQRRKRR
jgi:hypothetical protein